MTRAEAERIIFDSLGGLTPEWLEEVAYALGERNILTDEAMIWLAVEQEQKENSRRTSP
jgi:hypothetical protein